MLEQLGFGIVAFALLFAALRAVTSQNLVHSVLWLALVLAATALLFALLRAPLLAAIQIILYTGGILTLMLFGVMLTQRDPERLVIPNDSRRRAWAGALAAATFALFAFAVVSTPSLPSQRGPAVPVREVGALFFTEFALAFELLALLLLAATLGAIVLSRRVDAGNEAAAPAVPARRPLPPPSTGEGQTS